MKALLNLKALREPIWFLVRYGVLLAGFCAFLVGVFFIFQGLIQQRELIEKESRINVWFLAQTEIEFIRFTESLKDFELEPNSEMADQARERFEIFWSRLPPLLQGSQTADLRAIDGVVPSAQAMIRTLEEVEPLMEDLESLSAERLDRLHEELDGMRGPVHDLVRRALLYESNEVSSGRARHDELYRQLLALFALALVVGVVIFALLFLQIIKTRRAVVAKDQAAVQAIRARKELELAINSISEGFIVFDREDRVELFNQRYVDLHKQQADILAIGVSFEDMLRAAVRNGGVKIEDGKVDEWVNSILEKRRETAETTFESRKSTGHWLRISERRTSDGRLVAVHTDITELKEHESQIEQKSELLQTTLDNMRQGIAVFDSEMNLVLFNNQYLQINQYPAGFAVPHMQYRELATYAAKRGDFGPGEPDNLVESQVTAIRNLMREGTGNLRQLRYLSDGRVVETIVAALPTGGFVKTYDDITERVASEAERARLTEMYHAAQRTQALGTLAGGIAHDFNNIIGSILGNCSLLISDTQKDDRAFDRINQIMDSGTRARDLVRQILTYSRNAESDRKPIDVGSVVRDSLTTLRPLLPANVSIQANNFDSCFIDGDATQIHQVMLNVCVNAAQAIGDAKGTITISIKCIDIVASEPPAPDPADAGPGGKDRSIRGVSGTLHDGPYAQVTITDTGSGIPEEVMPRIFEPFYTTKEVGQGTGLGLAAVHGIVRNHDAAIVVESLAGVGTRFDFYFPTIDNVKPEVKNAAPTMQLTTGTERVMLIDDDRMLLSVTEEILKRLGYDVTSFVEPEAALEAFREDPAVWDLLITDRSMPKMTGEDLVLAVKKIRHDIPVLMLSGFVSSDDAERLTAQGIDALVGKPVLPNELASAVRGVLSGMPVTELENGAVIARQA